MEQYDILLDVNEELQADNNYDIKLGFVDNKLMKYIILASPGHYKTNPQIGVGIYDFINATSNPSQIHRAIKLQLEADVFRNPEINVDNFPVIYVNKATFNVA